MYGNLPIGRPYTGEPIQWIDHWKVSCKVMDHSQARIEYSRRMDEYGFYMEDVEQDCRKWILAYLAWTETDVQGGYPGKAGSGNLHRMVDICRKLG